MTTIAAWNVNSVKSRLPHLLRWLEAFAPDVVLLQEIKTVEENFPALEIGEAGYHMAVMGQKTYNGVAILSRAPIDEVTATRLPGDDEDQQARYVEASIGGLRAASLYVPNGNPVGTEKFEYKKAWLDRLYAHVQGLLERDLPFVLGGDWNIAPADGDIYDPKGWGEDALCLPEIRRRWRKIVHLGLTDAFRALNPETGRFTWWDYRGGAWDRDQGLRIDHLLLSPRAADRLRESGVDRRPRGWEKPSDHTPVWCVLDD